MAEKNLNNIRIVNKHDTEENWLKATGFTPKQGELIVYDIDDNYSYERIKIGDGVQNVNALPFVDDNKQDKDFVVNLTAGKLSADKTFAEITAAYNAGRRVIAKRFTMQFPLIVLSDEMAIFALEIVKDMSYIHFYCSSDDVWQELNGNSMPDVSGQINAHNSSTTAHTDIRTSINELSALVGDTAVSEQIEAAAEVYVGPTRPTDSNIKVWINTSEEGTGVVPIIPIVSSVALPASGWTGYNPYSQTVDVPSASSTSMITLQPSAQQILDLQNEEITMTVENDGNGNITFYCINGIPSFNMNMQILISAVAYA